MLKVKRIGIDTHRENVAFLSRACTVYRAEEFRALDKIEVATEGLCILAVLNIVDDPAIVPADTLGLSEPAFRRLGAPEGGMVRIAQASPPESLDAIRAKVAGETLTESALEAVVRDIAGHRYSRMEIAAFLIACASFMSSEEVLGLTRAMARVGNVLEWDVAPVVDKHCIGGIPGNRTSMIVVPIVAAHGLPIPKTSSRAITSPAGTADTMEVLANVDIDVGRMQELVREVGGCLVWGGRVNLSPADDVLISVERPLSIDAPEQLVASILSKKLAAGSTHLLVDIPLGPTAKVRSRTGAVRLRKLFEYVGRRVGLVVDVIITDGSQPIGNGVGPVLEARDVMQVLRGEAEAPADLRERALLLAGRVLEFDPELTGGHGYERARALLEGGQALDAMERIIAGQGAAAGVDALGALVHEVVAPGDGVVGAIDCERIARLARLAGAPLDKGSGIDLLRKVGDPVSRGDALYRIHAHFPSDFQFATDYAAKDPGYRVEAG